MKCLFSLLLLLVFIQAPTGFAQEEFVNNNCPYINGEFYTPNAVVRYEHPQRQIVMVSLVDGSVIRTVESNVFVEHLGVIEWSYNCRYLFAFTEVNRRRSEIRTNGRGTMVIWDVISGERLQNFEYPTQRCSYQCHSFVNWGPDSSHALFRTANGFFIWQATDNLLTILTHAVEYYFRSPNLDNAHWDFEGNRVFISGNPCTLTYDLTTGNEIGCYRTSIEPAIGYGGQDTDFILSDDRQFLAVFTDQTSSDSSHSHLSVWNLNDNSQIELNINLYAARPNQIAFSQDNRYLVLGSRSVLRVWDIRKLSSNLEDRAPIYIHGGPEGAIGSVRFVDWGVIETISDDGIQHWDLHTGTYVGNS